MYTGTTDQTTDNYKFMTKQQDRPFARQKSFSLANYAFNHRGFCDAADRVFSDAADKSSNNHKWCKTFYKHMIGLE